MLKWFRSDITLFVVILIVAYFVFNGGIHNILTYDIFAHYIYLPLVFDRHEVILSDLTHLEYLRETYQVSDVLYQIVSTNEGYHFTKCTVGWAILELPFYLIAECWANAGGFATDGFTHPYRVMMFIGSIFWLVIGLIYTRKILRHFFADHYAALLLVLLVFGTNFFYMTHAAVGQSNNFAFTFCAIMVWRIICFYKNQSTKNAMAFAAAWAILILIRPPDGILGLLFFVWRVNFWRDFPSAFKWFWYEKRRQMIALFSVWFVILFPQMLYWFLSTGSFLINSYANNPGEGFDFFYPHLPEFLFSFRKGWLIYTPLMLFAFFGWYYMSKKNQPGKAFAFVSLLFLYVIASWSCWWYGGSFGSRAAIDMYPICIVMIGFALQHVYKGMGRIAILIIIPIVVSLNLIQTYQINHWIIDPSFMTRDYYVSTFLQLSPPTPEQNKLLCFNHAMAYESGFNEKNKAYYPEFSFSEKFVEPDIVGPTDNYATELFLSSDDYVTKSHAWLKVTWQYDPRTELQGTIFYVAMSHGNDLYSWTGYEAGLDDGRTEIDSLNNTISFYFLTPYIRSVTDPVVIGAMKHDGQDVYLLGRSVIFFAPKVDHE